VYYKIFGKKHGVQRWETLEVVEKLDYAVEKMRHYNKSYEYNSLIPLAEYRIHALERYDIDVDKYLDYRRYVEQFTDSELIYTGVTNG